MKRYIFAAIILLVGAAGCRQQSNSASGPSGSSGTGTGAVEIEFWHTQTEKNAEALRELVSRFNAAHEGKIHVRELWVGEYSKLYQKVMSAIRGGTPPDTAISYESMVAEYMKAGVVHPLDEYLADPESKKVVDDIFPAYLASNRFDEYGGKLLSFPFTKSVLVLYYNEQALKEAGLSGPPKTWAEFHDAAVKMTKRDAGGNVTRYGTALWPDASTIDGIFLSNGGKLLSDDGKRVAFNAPPARAALDILADLVKKNAALVTSRNEYQAEFGNGRVGMLLGSSTARERIIPAVAGKFPWGIAVIPQADPAKPVTVQYGANIAVFKTTPEKQRAGWELVRWLAEPEQTTYWATHSTYMPICQSVASRPEMQEFWKKDPQAKQAFEVARYGVREPNVRGWQDVRDILEEAYTQITSGQKTPAAALAEAETKSNQKLKEKQ